MLGTSFAGQETEPFLYARNRAALKSLLEVWQTFIHASRLVQRSLEWPSGHGSPAQGRTRSKLCLSDHTAKSFCFLYFVVLFIALIDLIILYSFYTSLQAFYTCNTFTNTHYSTLLSQHSHLLRLKIVRLPMVFDARPLRVVLARLEEFMTFYRLMKIFIPFYYVDGIK